MNDIYKSIYDQDFPVDGVPHGSIQWKGTDVCMDVRCVCGAHSHVDGDFVYGIRCPACKRQYAVGYHVKLIELTPEQVGYHLEHHSFYEGEGE